MNKNLKTKIINFVVDIAILLIVIFTIGFVVSVLWNGLMPAIFGLSTISFTQGVNITLLVYALSLPAKLEITNNKK